MCKSAKVLLQKLKIEHKEVDVGRSEGLVDFTLITNEHDSRNPQQLPGLEYVEIVAEDVPVRKFLQGAEVVSYLARRLKARGGE